jgi:outer membrane protein TolC
VVSVAQASKLNIGSRIVLAAAVLGSLIVSVPAHAQAVWPAPVDDPQLSSLIEEALSKNPDVAAAREAALAAAQRPVQASSLANPMLSVDYTNDGWSPSLGSMEMTTLGVMASQELPYPGKRALRGDIAVREASQVQQQAERVGRGITADVKRAYYALLLSRNLLELIGDQEAIWKQIEGVARARYAVGQGAQQDVLRVQVEVTRIEQLRTEQQAESDVRLAELNRLLDRPVTAALETPAPLVLRPLAAGLDQLVQWANGISPELKGAALGIERATLAVDLARKEYKPDFSLRGAYMNRGGLPPMWQAGVGISVPAYRKRLAAGVGEADARLRSSQSTLESLRLQLRYRTQERLTQIKTTERIATLYGEGIVPQDRMSLEAALANYQTGKVPFIAVLEALTTLYNDRAKHLQLLATHEQTLASLEEASLGAVAGMAPTGASGMAAVGGSSLSMAGAGSASGGSGGMGNQ